jgi:ABC-type spermidine/putrescine transport system permease subunit I
MATSMLTFVHAMAEFVTSSVLDALSESIAEKLQEADGRDISPFGDDEA